MKRIISTILCSLLLLTVMIGVCPTAKANAETDSRAYPAAPLLLEDVDSRYYDFELTAEIDNLAMYINEKTVNIAILNKKTGMIWSSEVRYDGVEVGKDDSARFRSLFFQQTSSAFEGTGGLTEFFCGSLLNETEIGPYGKGADAKYDYMNIDYASVSNGVRVTAHFFNGRHPQSSAIGDISVIDFFLDAENETFVVSFDTDIQNYAGSDAQWVAIDILPFFMSAVDSDDGYIFYPDGSGTIAEFTPHHSTHESIRRLSFYSANTPNVSTLLENEKNGVMPILYPVLGITKNGEAIFAIQTDGVEQSGFVYAPSGAITNVNRVYFEFFIQELLTHLGGNSRYRGRLMTDKYYRVEYHFLDTDESDYSGMAKEYREYLKKNGLLNDVISEEDSMPLAVDYYMNTSTTNIFGEQAIIMTTFAEISSMVTELHDNGVKDMLVNISAWQEFGDATNTVIPVYSRIGGLNGLKSLVEKIKEYGFDIFMEVNMEYANSSTTKFKASRDAIQNISGTAINSTYYLIAPQVILDRYEEIYFEYFKNSGISGFNFEQLGYYIYNYNYKEEHFDKFTCADLFTKVLANSKEDFGKNAIWYGNQYSLQYADWIYDLPSTDTGYANTTREIPFAQLVLHSYIPYTSIAGNTFYDDQLQTLKWIEYGYVPYYKLTYESTSELANTEMEVLFSAQYSDWSESVIAKYKALDEEFGYLYNVEMVAHNEVKEGVYYTEYADGTRVYVNYTNSACYTADGIVHPVSYLKVNVKG